mgnify:CR=1 FL=1
MSILMLDSRLQQFGQTIYLYDFTPCRWPSKTRPGPSGTGPDRDHPKEEKMPKFQMPKCQNANGIGDVPTSNSNTIPRHCSPSVSCSIFTFRAVSLPTPRSTQVDLGLPWGTWVSKKFISQKCPTLVHGLGVFQAENAFLSTFT